MFWQRLKLSDTTQHTLKTIVTWTVVFIAYSYLIYSLYTTDWQQLLPASVSWYQLVVFLLPVCCLLPLNLLLEALKWRRLLWDFYPMSIREAQRQVYYGLIGAFVTPYRAGEYPTRVLLMRSADHWKRAIAMGVYGSIVLTAVIILAGLGPFWASMSVVASRPWYCLLVLILPLTYFFPKWGRLTGEIAFLSLLRYAVYSTQMYLMLRFFGVALSPAEALSAIPYYYLLVTVTPNIPISDPAIRGSWAIIAFGPTGAIAALALWFINVVIPTIIGGLLPKQ